MKHPGRDGRRTLVAVAEVLAAGRPFPTVDEIAATGRVSDRGKASNSLRQLEWLGYASRTSHKWRTGSLTPAGQQKAAIYAADPARWLPDRAPVHRAPRPPGPSLEGTAHPMKVRYPAHGRPLRDGNSNQKLGGWVTKGHWAGARIMTLALEERATCPGSCAQWDSCYGDHMGLALRVPHGPELERRLVAQLDGLQADVVAVRLHELGDFYSVAYVALWASLLRKHPWLHIFGYTAWTPLTPIGSAVQAMNKAHPERCWIRTSGHGERMGAYVVKPGETRPDAFACPEQTNRVANCGACGACWSTTRNVLFLEH